MSRQPQLSGLLSFLLILHVPVGFAQDEEPNQGAGQEVEVNEDNYRQFMELKDTRGQRNMLPENAFKPGSGTQKLDKLPEESQKHLRNQLREIIVQGDQWQPGDEDTQYPYVPSNAATTDSDLQKQEAEAWGELVENYHQREAEIYKNSARTQAAMAAGSASGTGTGSNGGEGGAESGPGGSGQGGEGQESSQPTQGEQGGAADSYSPNAQNDPDAESTQGVSQNAMEFLSGKRRQMANTGESAGSGGESRQNNESKQAASQGETEARQNAQQQAAQQQGQPGNNGAENVVSASPDVQAQVATGSSQNALRYVTGRQNQEGQDESSTPTGEPLPALPSSNAQETPGTQDTLTIQDLLNAQGVRDATGTGPTTPGATVGPVPGGKDPDKDTDG